MVAGALIMRAGLVIIGEVLRRIYERMIQLIYLSMSNRAMLQKPSTTTASQLPTLADDRQPAAEVEKVSLILQLACSRTPEDTRKH